MIRIKAIQMVADGDEFHDCCTLVVAGRPINVPEPLEQILDCLDGRSV